MKNFRYARVGATALAILALSGCTTLRQPRVWGSALAVAVVAGATVALASQHSASRPCSWICKWNGGP